MRSHLLYHLNDRLTVCLFTDGAICLDVADDHYFRLRLPFSLETDTEDRLVTVIDRLHRRGLLASDVSAADRIQTVSVRIPDASLLEGVHDDPAPHGFANALSALARTALSLRLRPLRTILTDVKRRRSVGSTNNVAWSITSLAASFHCHRKLVPMAPACLLDSLALLLFLSRFGHHPTLIFGVTAHPFSAHCWVQTDDMLLSDAAGHAGHFRPILAL